MRATRSRTPPSRKRTKKPSSSPERKKKLTPHKIDFSEIEESYERVIQKNAPDLIKDPETDIFQDMMDEDVKRAQDSLPHDYKMVVLLADIEGFSYKEIAEILDCPENTVKTRMFYARKQLAALLKVAGLATLAA